MEQRKRDAAIIVLRCVIVGCCAYAYQTVSGAEEEASPKPGNGSSILEGQEIKNADAPAEPQAVMSEIKSATSLSGGKMRRRRPKMAGVPVGSPTVAQEAKEPESQAVTQEGEETDTLDKSVTAPQETKEVRLLAKPEESKPKEQGKKRYAMAPIRWGGRITETVRLERHTQATHAGPDAGSGKSWSEVVNKQTAEVHASTYYLHPYIARMDVRLGVNSSKSNKNDTNVNGINQTSSSRDNNLFGNGIISVFSQSRFPFEMEFGVEGDRTNGESATNNVAIKHLDMVQSYFTRDGLSSYAGNYQFVSSDISNLGALSRNNRDNTINTSSWNGRYNTLTPEQTIKVKIKLNERVTNTLLNTSKRTDDVTVEERYFPQESLWAFHSFANLNWFSDNNSFSHYLLANTAATWQPESEEIPLFVNGNIHLFKQLTVTNNDAAVPVSVNASQSLGGNIGARYIFSKNLSANASGSVTRTNKNEVQSLDTTQQAFAIYQSDAAKIWKNSSYSWHANGGANNSSVSGIHDRNIFAGVGHGLSVPFDITISGEKAKLRTQINQSLTANFGQTTFDDKTALNAAAGTNQNRGNYIKLDNEGKVILPPFGFGIQHKQMGENGRISPLGASAVLSLRDVRRFGDNPSHTTTLTLSTAEKSNATYAREGITLNATLGSSQKNGKSTIFFAGSAIADYYKRRVFNVRGLDYKVHFNISREMGSDTTTAYTKFPWEFNQGLVYKIGMNEVSLTNSFYDKDGVKNASLWLLFRAWRDIGYF